MALLAGLKDALLRLVFTWGAKTYSNKLATGPEAELRKEFLAFAGPPSEARVLDVGCGPGWLAIAAARQTKEAVGIDRSKRIIQLARQNARLEGILNVGFQNSNAFPLPFPDGHFDLAIATTLVYLLTEPEKAISEMARVVKPSGRVATLDPDRSMSPKKMRSYAEARNMSSKDTKKLLAWASGASIYYPFSEERLRALYEKAGLKNILLEKRMDGMVWFAKGEKPF